MDYVNRSLQFGSSHNELPRTPTDEEKMNKIVGWVPPTDLEPHTTNKLKPFKLENYRENNFNLMFLVPVS